jgi:hypothetical protein
MGGGGGGGGGLLEGARLYTAGALVFSDIDNLCTPHEQFQQNEPNLCWIPKSIQSVLHREIGIVKPNETQQESVLFSFSRC